MMLGDWLRWGCVDMSEKLRSRRSISGESDTCRGWRLGAAGVCLLSLAWAAPGEAADEEPGTGQLAEVVVTSNRLGEQDLQKTPITVTALDTDTLDRTNLDSLADITRNVPGINVTDFGGGQNVIIIRGVTTDGLPVNTDNETQPTVSVYLDDTPISLAGATPDLRVFDLERVEVVRGPQGTLYGAGAMAGNIRYITRKPDATAFDALIEASGDYTDYGTTGYTVRGLLNTPLVADRLALRVGIYQGEDPGWIDNVLTGEKNVNSQRNTQLRAALRLANTGNWTVDASYLYGRVQRDENNNVYSELAKDQYAGVVPGEYHDRYQILNLTAEYKAESFDFISSTSYDDRTIDSTTDQSFFGEGISTFFTSPPVPAEDIPTANVLRSGVHDFAQELRIASTAWKHWKGQAGIFYEHQGRDQWQNFPSKGFDALWGGNSLDLGAFTTDTFFSGQTNAITRQVAVFGELTYSPNERFDLTVGARHFDWHQSFNLYFAGLFGINPSTGAPLTVDGTSKESGTNPRVNAAFHVTPDVMVFAEAAKGFRYGGINQPVPLGPPPACSDYIAPLTSAPLTFGPDYLWSYSLGEKASLLDRRLTLDATVYELRWKDVQTRKNLPECGYYYIENKGDVRSDGVEFEAQWQATPSLAFGITGAYTDARADGAIPNLNAPDGARAPYFPRFTASLQGTYRRNLSIGNFLLTADFSHRGDVTTDFDATAADYRTIPANNVVNAAATLQHGRVEVTLYGRNLTNEKIILGNAANVGPGAPYTPGDLLYIGRPLTVGLKVGVRFQ
jgi:iron complex outermembrane recepter protein